MKHYLLSIITNIFFFLSSLINAQTCEDTNNGVLNPWGNDCSFYSNNAEECGSWDGIYYQGGMDYIDEFGYTEFVAYEMCCECGGGTDYPYPYDCQDNETAINFYGGNFYEDIGWEIQNCDGSTFLSGGAPFFDCVELPSDGYQVVVTDAAANGWQMDTSIGAYGTLQIGDQDYGLLSGGYDLHIGTCGSCQDGQEYIDLFVGTNNPWEMTWEILDSNGNLITSGDGYTADGCYDVPCPYTINMFDSQGDGWVYGNNPDAGNITIGDQVYTVYSGYVELDGVLWLMDGNSQSDTYNDCTINISEDCENTDNGAVDSYGDSCSSWYDANETPGSAGCTGQYDTDSFIAAEMCCACGGGSEPLCDEGYEIDPNGNCVFGSLGCTGSGASNYDPEATVDDGSCVFSNCINEYTAYGVANCDDAVINLGWTCEGLEADYGFDCSGCNCGDGQVFCTDATACNFGEEGECTFATELVDCDGNSTCDGTWVENTINGDCSDFDNNLSYCNITEGCYSYSYPVFGCFFCPNIEGCGGTYVIDTEYVCEDGSGCTDSNACNYNSSATQDNGACTYPNLGYDCNGVCINDADSDGVCDNDEILGCTDSVACNYSSNATDDNNSCSFADEGYDCDGNPVCSDTDNGATDVDGDGCSAYTNNPNWCNGYDDEDFISSEMCCACGGGTDFEVPTCSTGTIITMGGGDGLSQTSWSIEDCFGNIVASESGDVNGDGSIYTICVDLPEIYSIWMGDTNGNTWNGNILTIDGIEYTGPPQTCSSDPNSVYNPSGVTCSDMALVGNCSELDGCDDETACNYDPMAVVINNNTCEYAYGGIDCDGNSICDGTWVEDITYGDCSIYNSLNGGTYSDCVSNTGLYGTGCSWEPFGDSGVVIYSNCLGINTDNDLVFNDGWIIEDNSYCNTGNNCLDPTACNYGSEGECIYTDADGDGVCDNDEIPGCTDNLAMNFNSSATDDDGSCQFTYGCTDLTACNYDETATVDDESCTYSEPGFNCDGEEECLDTSNGATDQYGDGCDWYDNNPDGCGNWDTNSFIASEMCCACDGGTNFEPILGPGCTDNLACNYDEYANEDNGSCIYPDSNFDCDGNCNWAETSISYSWDGSNQGENTWIISNENGEIIWEDQGSGFNPWCWWCGPPSTNVCIDPNGCYDFTLSDSGGDGWNGNSLTFENILLESPIIFTLENGSTETFSNCLVCNDINACNFEVEENCIYDLGCGCGLPPADSGYDCDGVCLFDTDNDGVCDEFELLGCLEPTACNYDSTITTNEDNSLCVYVNDACETCSGDNDGTGTVVDNDLDNDGVCNGDEILGCTDSSACNYDSSSTTDTDNTLCEYAVEYLNCDGDCINDTDGDGTCDELEILGCTDSTAFNYDLEATEDDDSCMAIIFGCIDSMYLEFNSAANTDDGSCVNLIIEGCTNDSYLEYNSTANTDNGSCTNLLILGCTDSSYLEYDSAANMDDDSCVNLIIEGCTNDSYLEYDSTANTDNGSCTNLLILGCTDSSYLEYDSAANIDNGSCTNLLVLGCTDSSYLEYDLSANLDDGSCDNLIVLGCTNPEAVNYNLYANTDDDSCEFSPFDVIQTDCNMTVLLPADLNISLDGEQITSSVWIGVTDSDGIVCGEALFNPGNVNSVIVWDESNSSYGMSIGETLNWIAMIDGEMTSGEALYQPWGYDEFACNGLSGITSLNFISSSTFTQEIELETGWGIWSTYINSENPDMINVFSDIVNDLTIVKDETGLVYWPAFNLNTIGNLTEGKGYQVKMINPATLILEGTLVPIDTELTLPQGWSIMGYLDQNCNSADNLMAPIFNELIILKNETGLVYWPTFNLNSIGDMCPDKGYQVKMNEVSSFNYSSTSNTSRYGDLFVERPIHFEEPKNTGNNMIIGLPLNSWESTPSIGDEIAAYGEDGELIGSTTFQGNHIALTIWGDDLTTDKKDGISQGEFISFKLWNSQTGIEQALDLRWSKGFGFYTADGISIAGQIILGIELTTNKQLVRITDALGREVNGNKKDIMLIYIYDDGSIERVFIKE